MKVWVSITILAIILVLVIGAGLGVIGFVNTQVDEMSALLNRAMEAVVNDDREQAVALFSNFQDTWDGGMSFWELLVHYHELDNIDTSIARTNVLLRSEDTAAIEEELANLIESLAHLKEREQLRLQHIL